MRYFKVGGLKFLRVGSLQVSWCVVKRKRKINAPMPITVIEPPVMLDWPVLF
jgi:hypothetical protein